MKKKFLATTTAVLMAFTMAFSGMGNVVKASVEVPVDVSLFNEGIEIQEDTISDIRYQEPVEITRLVHGESESIIENEDIIFDPENAQELPIVYSTVMAGTVSDTLTATDDYKIYNISLPAYVYFQAQLTMPNSANIDYDLYLLDSNGNILTGSDYYTYINGTSGTLAEALGYITTDDVDIDEEESDEEESDGLATYYLYVLSSNGGSVSQEYILDYSISTACDAYEPDESVREAWPFTFGVTPQILFLSAGKFPAN